MPGLDYIPLVFLKNRVPELSYILGELFNQFVSEGISFSNSVVPVIENVGCRGGSSRLKTIALLVFFGGSVKSLKNV